MSLLPIAATHAARQPPPATFRHEPFAVDIARGRFRCATAIDHPCAGFGSICLVPLPAAASPLPSAAVSATGPLHRAMPPATLRSTQYGTPQKASWQGATMKPVRQHATGYPRGIT